MPSRGLNNQRLDNTSRKVNGNDAPSDNMYSANRFALVQLNAENCNINFIGIGLASSLHIACESTPMAEWRGGIEL